MSNPRPAFKNPITRPWFYLVLRIAQCLKICLLIIFACIEGFISIPNGYCDDSRTAPLHANPSAAELSQSLTVQEREVIRIALVRRVRERLRTSPDDENGGKEQLLSQLITVVKSKENEDLEITPAMLESVRVGLRTYPTNILAFLAKSKCRVVVAPRLEDASPTLAEEHPPGYRPFLKLKNISSVFLRNTVYIAENYYDGRTLVRSLLVPDVTQHETAHAIDFNLGRISESEPFIAAYNDDVKGIEPTDFAKLAYYLQAGSHGTRETFAALLSFKFGGANPMPERDLEHVHQVHLEHVHKVFQRCSQLIDELFRLDVAD